MGVFYKIMEKRLGKIISAEVCPRTYTPTSAYGNPITVLVLKLELGGKGTLPWRTEMEYSIAAEYGYNRELKTDTVIRWLKDVNATCIDDLVDVPIEAELDSNILKDFRILTEVL